MTGARPTLLAVIALAWVAVGSACGGTGAREVGPRVEIRDAIVSVEVVSSGEAQRLGLGRRDSLAWDRGMLFVYDQARFYAFWMKDMRFDIDMVWIRGDRIVDMHHRVPAPTDDTTELPSYRSSELCDRVLEVPAGYAQAHGWRKGDTVVFRDLP